MFEYTFAYKILCEYIKWFRDGHKQETFYEWYYILLYTTHS